MVKYYTAVGKIALGKDSLCVKQNGQEYALTATEAILWTNLAWTILSEEDLKRKFMMVSDYIVNNLETGEKAKAKAQKGEGISIGENKEMYLSRSMRDRKMCLYKNDELIMVLKCKTIIRN